MTIYTFTTTSDDDVVLDFWSQRGKETPQDALNAVISHYIASRKREMHTERGREMDEKFRGLSDPDKAIVTAKLGLN